MPPSSRRKQDSLSRISALALGQGRAHRKSPGCLGLLTFNEWPDGFGIDCCQLIAIWCGFLLANFTSIFSLHGIILDPSRCISNGLTQIYAVTLPLKGFLSVNG